MAINLTALKAEITTDPLTRGYSGMSDDAIAASLAVPNRQADREALDSGTLVASIVSADYVGLTANQKDYVRLVAMATSVPLTAALKSELGAIFPAGSTTRANLIALQKRPGTRAEELNLGGQPTASDVANAKRLP